MKNKLGFTLVELIVVVTILAILGTIGFVSYSSYLTGVRDANRTASLEAISSGLSLYTTSAKSLPIPDQEVSIYSGSTFTNPNLVAYQGQAGVTVLESIDYSKAGEDPSDREPYRYMIDKARKYHQLVAFAEEADTAISYNILFPQANAVDLSLRYPVFYGEKLGMFIENSDDTRPMDASVLGDVESSIQGLMSTFDIYYDGNSSTGSINTAAYANTIQAGGIVSSCAVLNAKKGLTSTGTYLVNSGGLVVTDDCGPNS